jgi:hypothetical protein
LKLGKFRSSGEHDVDRGEPDEAEVDAEPFGVVVVAQLGGDAGEDAPFAPAVGALPETVGLAEAGGEIGPSDAGLGEVADGVEEEPGIVADAPCWPTFRGSRVRMRFQWSSLMSWRLSRATSRDGN